MHKQNWDDLRFVLEVAEAGTISAAARRLGVNHATVLRRVSALETRLGAEIFLRSPQGYQIRPDRLRLLQAMREVATAVEAVDRAARTGEFILRGRVRITSTDTICTMLLPGLISGILARAPELRLSVLSSNSRMDLSRMQADISVAPSMALRDGLVGEAACEMEFGLYAAPKAADQWLTGTGPLDRGIVTEWVIKHAGGKGIAVEADSFLVLAEMAAAGLGRVALPCFVGEPDKRLNRIDGVMPRLAVPVWVASQEDIASVPRFMAVRQLLLEGLRGLAPVLSRTS